VIVGGLMYAFIAQEDVMAGFLVTALCLGQLRPLMPGLCPSCAACLRVLWLERSSSHGA
jgi:hypothetical protein